MQGDPQMECRLTFALTDSGGAELAAGKGVAVLKEESFSLAPEAGPPLLISYRDITDIGAGDYQIRLALGSGECLRLSQLGRAYEGFGWELRRLYNQQLVRDLLMDERLLKDGLRATMAPGGAGSDRAGGECELRLYETALVVMTESDDPLRIPLSEVSEARVEDYALVLELEDGTSVTFSRMGKKLDHAHRSVSRAMEELSLRVQSTLKELLPAADAPTIWRAAALMKEGRAALRGALEQVSAELWPMLAKKVAEAGIGEEYQTLSRLGRPQKTCIGVKRGLMGDLTGEYVWFLVPMYGEDPGEPGNAIAMEVVSEEGKGGATYFFRILDPAEYRSPGSFDVAEARVDELTKTINRCLQAINFRREPIYLPEERFSEPRYARYAVAVRKIPELRRLRELFIGRVVHASFEQWQRDVNDLLRSGAGL